MAAESAQDRALFRSIFGTRFGKTQHRTGRRSPCFALRLAGLLKARLLVVRVAYSIVTTSRPMSCASSSRWSESWSSTVCANRSRHSSSLNSGISAGTIEGAALVWTLGISSPFSRIRHDAGSGSNESIWRSIHDAGSSRDCVTNRGLRVSLERILAPRAGFEPATIRLTVECSTAELPRNKAKQSFASGQRITKPPGLAKDEIGRSGAPSPPLENPLRAAGYSAF